jgi:hypothetical protein
MSEHAFAVASQKFTCPGLTAEPPAWTVAVSVITVPGATTFTATPPAVTANVVVVAAPWAEAAVAAITRIMAEIIIVCFNEHLYAFKRKTD